LNVGLILILTEHLDGIVKDQNIEKSCFTICLNIINAISEMTKIANSKLSLA